MKPGSHGQTNTKNLIFDDPRVWNSCLQGFRNVFRVILFFCLSVLFFDRSLLYETQKEELTPNLSQAGHLHMSTPNPCPFPSLPFYPVPIPPLSPSHPSPISSIPVPSRSYHIMLYHIMLYHIISYHMKSNHIISYHVFVIFDKHRLSYPIVYFLDDLTIWYHTILNTLLCYMTWYDMISYDMIQYNIL